MSEVGKEYHDTTWRDILTNKGLSRAAPVLEKYGLSCENDMSLLEQEDLIALDNKITQFHIKILCTWVQRLGTGGHHHKTDDYTPAD